MRAYIEEHWIVDCKHHSGVPPQWCGLCDDEKESVENAEPCHDQADH
jgi:hypothetical protein